LKTILLEYSCRGRLVDPLHGFEDANGAGIPGDAKGRDGS